MHVLIYQSGDVKVTDEAPDSWEIRECRFKEVSASTADAWRKRAVLASAVAEMLLAGAQVESIKYHLSELRRPVDEWDDRLKPVVSTLEDGQ